MNELIVLEKLDPVAVYNGGLVDVLKRIEDEAKSVLLDPSTETGRKDIASIAYKVARSKTLLDDMGKTLGEEAKRKVDAINADRKKARDFLDVLKEEIRKPLTDFENAEKERIKRHEDNINEIIGGGTTSLENWQTINLEAMKDRLKEIEAERVLDWQEFKNRAELAINEATAKIKQAIDQREKFEAEQKELEAFRKAEAERAQKEREEQIRKEAAEQAKREAEANALKEKEAADRALREAKEREEAAIKAAKEAAERAEREKQEAIRLEREKVEAEKKAEEVATAKREADKKHKAKINNEALKAIGSLPNMNEGVAKVIVEAIAKGKIPNVKIFY